jgi:type II secretory pathway pseudopilin PulG
MFMTLKMNQDNPDEAKKTFSLRLAERSFTLVETVVAVSLIALLIIEVSAVHGNAINFADYSRKALQASYLAKRVMSQVEYQSSWRTPLKDLATSEKDKTFEDTPEFTYNLTIEPLPNALELMFKIMSGGLLGGSDGEDSGGADGEGGKPGVGAMLEQIKGMVETAVGEDPIWMARVEVFWPEGARRSSVDLSMIITDTKKLETTLGPLLAKAPSANPTPNPNPNPSPN